MSAFEDFIQVELPRRPWTVDDPAQETVPVRRGPGPRRLEFVDMTDGQVLGKIGGIVQGVTIPGLGGSGFIPKNYIHQQPVPLLQWSIPHNLASEDYVVAVFDDTGSQVIPDSVTTVDNNNITIDFGYQMAGKAVIVFAS